MRCKIYQVGNEGMDTYPSNRFDNPVYQQATVKLIEMGFSERQNDFTTMDEALEYIAGSRDLQRNSNLTILPFISSMPPIS